MSEQPRQITLDEWEARYACLRAAGVLPEYSYGGPLGRHVRDGDLRLRKLRFDNSPAALRLWNFLLTEEERLHQARRTGSKLVATMKDLGTVPVIVFALEGLVAFYPDGTWWTPCVMEHCDGLLRVAYTLGIPDTFCPVRAMLGAFVEERQFPRPDLIVCSAGATCDDFSAIAGRLESLGFPIFWWEIPHRQAFTGEEAVQLPNGFVAARSQVAFVRDELERVKAALEGLAGRRLDEAALSDGIRQANGVRGLLEELRRLVFTANPCPLPAMELLIAEMFAIHFCSDRAECLVILAELVDEVRRRVEAGLGVLSPEAVRVYWVNPVADLRVMNLLEECGGRIGGTDHMICHALVPIPEDVAPLEALARMALADPMVGSSRERAARISREARALGCEAVVVSRIPGASHCGLEGAIIADTVRREAGLTVVEIEVPPLSDAMLPTLRTRLEALVETARERRRA